MECEDNERLLVTDLGVAVVSPEYIPCDITDDETSVSFCVGLGKNDVSDSDVCMSLTLTGRLPLCGRLHGGAWAYRYCVRYTLTRNPTATFACC